MKIFKRDGKINFVDENNVFVGFDDHSCCCEQWGYYLTKAIPQRPEKDDYNSTYGYTPETLSDDEAQGFSFDTSFFEQLQNDRLYTESGGAVCFRLVKGVEQLFLTLYNTHNGYYSHGFDMKIGSDVLREGSI